MDKKHAAIKKAIQKVAEIPAIFLLPTETTKVLVQLKPALKISAFLPSRDREITFLVKDEDPDSEAETVSLTTPQLVLTQALHARELGPIASPEPEAAPFTPGTIYLNSVSCREGKFRTKPYTLSNVNSNGSICFGDGNYPKSLRAANNYFWGSSFNADLQNHIVYKECKCIPRKRINHDWVNCDFASEERKRLRKPNLKCDEPSCDCCRGNCPCRADRCPCSKGIDFKKTCRDFVKRHKEQPSDLNTILGTKYVLHPAPAEGVALLTKKCGLNLPKGLWKPTVRPDQPLAVGFVKSRLPLDNWSISFPNSKVVITLPSSKVKVF